MEILEVAQTVGGISAPFLLLAGTWLGVKHNRRSSKESNLTEHWDAYGQRMEVLHQRQQEWMEARLAERDARINALSVESERQSSEIRHLSEKIEAVYVKYRSALGHIGRIRLQLLKHISPDHIEPIPREIESDM